MQGPWVPSTIITHPPYHNLMSPSFNSLIYEIETIIFNFLSWAIVRSGESSLLVWKKTKLLLPEQMDYFY